MTVSVLLEGKLKDGERDGFTALLTEKFKLTKTFDGFQTIDLTYNVEDPNNWVITELWDSKEDYEKYLKFRQEDGTLQACSRNGVLTRETDNFGFCKCVVLLRFTVRLHLVYILSFRIRFRIPLRILFGSLFGLVGFLKDSYRIPTGFLRIPFGF